jgi:hypothetical protein
MARGSLLWWAIIFLIRISGEVCTLLFPKKESSKVGRSSKRGSEHTGCLRANHYDGFLYCKIEIRSVVQSIYVEREGAELWHFDSTN